MGDGLCPDLLIENRVCMACVDWGRLAACSLSAGGMWLLAPTSALINPNLTLLHAVHTV